MSHACCEVLYPLFIPPRSSHCQSRWKRVRVVVCEGLRYSAVACFSGGKPTWLLFCLKTSTANVLICTVFKPDSDNHDLECFWVKVTLLVCSKTSVFFWACNAVPAIHGCTHFGHPATLGYPMLHSHFQSCIGCPKFSTAPKAIR